MPGKCLKNFKARAASMRLHTPPPARGGGRLSLILLPREVESSLTSFFAIPMTSWPYMCHSEKAKDLGYTSTARDGPMVIGDVGIAIIYSMFSSMGLDIDYIPPF